MLWMRPGDAGLQGGLPLIQYVGLIRRLGERLEL